MLNCREVTELCSQEMERRLGLAERLRLQTHLMMCSGCTNFRIQMQTLRRAMHAYADGKAVDEGNKPPHQR
ncbi:MAG: zf-HC2 domain-containing protein [Burkholderiaceae bacterium]|nr:zf-HC2 domain-containing protein [Burkholderiaceae bacterium]